MDKEQMTALFLKVCLILAQVVIVGYMLSNAILGQKLLEIALLFIASFFIVLSIKEL